MLSVLQFLLQMLSAMLSWVILGFGTPGVRIGSGYSSGGPCLPALDGVDGVVGGVDGCVGGPPVSAAKEMFLPQTHPSWPSSAFTW